MIRPILLALLLFLPITSEAAEFWVGGSPWVWSGDKYDTVCDDAICREVDSRTSHIFEMTLLSGDDDDNVRPYFMAGWIRGMDSGGDGSYVFVGGGGDLRPFPNAVERLRVQVGIEFGRETIQHSEELRFRLGVFYVPRSERWYVPGRVGWCHRSTGRWFANLGPGRNEAINGLCLSYRILGSQ